jgi:hypothetical protein
MAESKLQTAPGTELLIDGDSSHLQHVKKGDGHVLLLPQPSLTDPNDPLRWPAWKKGVVSELSPRRLIETITQVPLLGICPWTCVQLCCKYHRSHIICRYVTATPRQS